MHIVKQLSVFMANRPGALSELISLLSQEKVNVEGFSVSDTVDHAVVRVVVDKPERTLHLLGDHGILCVENDILAVDLPNRPGALANLSQKLGRAKVNIEYAYGSAGKRGGAGRLFLRVGDLARAQKVIKNR